MRIEAYSDLYYLDVLKLVENFHREAVIEYDDLFDPKALTERIKSFNPENAFLLIINNVCEGILFGLEFESVINNRKIFQELIWYMNKPFRRYGIKLLKEVEKTLKSKGVSIMIMAVLENSKTEKIKSLYERMGYKPMEVHYVRNL